MQQPESPRSLKESDVSPNAYCGNLLECDIARPIEKTIQFPFKASDRLVRLVLDL